MFVAHSTQRLHVLMDVRSNQLVISNLPTLCLLALNDLSALISKVNLTFITPSVDAVHRLVSTAQG